MPFSTRMQESHIDELQYAQSSFKKRLCVTLQVRILFFVKILQAVFVCCGKKAFLSASGCRCRTEKQGIAASLTLEAALSLSLFIFASVCMFLPMKILNTDRKVQAALEAVGEDFSRYAYLKDMVERGSDVDIPGAGDFAKSFCRYLTAGAAEGYAQVMVMQHLDTKLVKNVRMIRSLVLEDGEIFDLIFDYEIQMPFPVLGMDRIERTARCRRRAWIGKPGKDFSNGGDGSSMDDEIVYVGKNSTRYHRSPNCHYLDNNLIQVLYEQVSGMRNDSGGKYYACRVCGMGAEEGSIVYLMPSGTSYHTTKNCTAINAYVRAVRRSEVVHLGPCSYCSKHEMDRAEDMKGAEWR